MNKRIRELMPKPWTFPYPDRELYTKEQFEKFAEMVIRECVATLKEDMELAHIQLIPLDFKMYANGRLQRTIKEHFGVKE